MAVVAVPPFLWPAPPWMKAIPSGVTSLNTINSAPAYSAFLYQAPKAGVIDWLECQVHAAASSPVNGLRMSIEGVTTAGIPDGTETQFRVIPGPFTAGQWIVPPGPLTSNGTNGGTPKTVVAGERFAVVVRIENFQTGDNITLRGGNNSGTSGYVPTDNFFYAVGSGSKLPNNDARCVLRYNDGTYPFLPTSGFYPVTDIVQASWDTADSPNERGAVLVAPYEMTVMGVCLGAALDASSTVTLYNAANTVLAQVAISPSANETLTTNVQLLSVVWPTPVTLTAGATYRLGVKALHPTTTIDLGVSTINSAPIREAFIGGTLAMQYTSRHDAGAWTDDPLQIPMVGLYISAIGAGGGGGGSWVF